MAEPSIGTAISRPAVAEFEQRRFDVNYGFRDRESVQVRLDPDNESVYMCYTEKEGRAINHATIPFAEFVKSFKPLVDSFR